MQSHADDAIASAVVSGFTMGAALLFVYLVGRSHGAKTMALVGESFLEGLRRGRKRAAPIVQRQEPAAA